MRIPLFFASLGLTMLIGLPLHAQEADVSGGIMGDPNSTNLGELMKNVHIHPKPKDFADMQRLALLNRQERRELNARTTACIQGAKTPEDIYNCQETERRTLTLIRLSFCDTGLSFITGRNRTEVGQTWPSGTPSECARALWAVTGQPMNWTEEQRAAGAKAVIEDLQKRGQPAPPAAALAMPGAAPQEAAPAQPPAQ
jgi:hypothetical protein